MPKPDVRGKTRGNPREFWWRWGLAGAFVASVAIGTIVWLRSEDTRPTPTITDAPEAARLERLGLSYLEQGRIEDAERAWKEAERRDPENVAVCVDLGRLLLHRGRWQEAAERFERALKRSPVSLNVLYNLSQANRMMGRLDEAERFRRLADHQRRIQPPRRTGMGADLDFLGTSTE